MGLSFMFVCICQGITDSQIKNAVAEGAMSVREVSQQLSVAKQCGKCALSTRQIVNQELSKMDSQAEELFYEAS